MELKQNKPPPLINIYIINITLITHNRCLFKMYCTLLTSAEIMTAANRTMAFTPASLHQITHIHDCNHVAI